MPMQYRSAWVDDPRPGLLADRPDEKMQSLRSRGWRCESQTRVGAALLLLLSRPDPVPGRGYPDEEDAAPGVRATHATPTPTLSVREEADAEGERRFVREMRKAKFPAWCADDVRPEEHLKHEPVAARQSHEMRERRGIAVERTEEVLTPEQKRERLLELRRKAAEIERELAQGQGSEQEEEAPAPRTFGEQLAALASPPTTRAAGHAA